MTTAACCNKQEGINLTLKTDYYETCALQYYEYRFAHTLIIIIVIIMHDNA